MSSIELVNTGILMGVIHVLTGPDHLSALATLCGTNLSSSNTKHNGSSGRQCESFLLGIKWGLGHSLGLLIVGGILIGMQEIDDDEWLSMDDTLMLVLNGFVGIFMIGLGCYGLLKAVHHRNDESAILLLDGSGDNKESVELNNSSNPRRQSNYSNSIREEEGEDEDSDDDEEEDASFFKDPEISGGPTIMDHRRPSLEILHQMSEVLNRDGDSMRRDSSSFSDNVEKRVLHAARSLRQNSSSISNNESDKNDNDNEEHFMKTVKASAKLALSQSFMDILTNDRSTTPPLSANVLMSKHENAQKVVLDKIYDDEQQQSRSSRIMGSMFCCCHYNKSCNNCTPGLLALITGIVHGLAGPGGVLGIIPAVQLKDTKLSAIYMSTFCATSTFTMGGFALFYGSFSTWLAGGEQSSHRQQEEGRRRSARSRIFLVEAGSAMLSIVVGIIWLVLLSIGDLEEVFS